MKTLWKIVMFSRAVTNTATVKETIRKTVTVKKTVMVKKKGKEVAKHSKGDHALTRR